MNWRDTDNNIKPLLDIAETVGLVSNDGNQLRLSVEPTERTDVLVTLTERPEIGMVRKPRARYPKSYKPSRSRIKKLESIRAKTRF